MRHGAGVVIRRGAPARGLSHCTPPGLSLDRARLHLLHRAAPAAAWDDVTAQVALELTHLYARFQVTRFSWSVPPPPRPPPHSPHPQPAGSPSPPLLQVLALVHHQGLRGEPGAEGLGAAAAAPREPHRAAETPGPQAGPAAVPAPQQGGGGGGPGDGAGAQGVGLPASGSLAPQVDATLRRLLERYRGPEPSDTVEMFEGEKFFAAFERGIDIDAGVPGRPGAGRWACPEPPLSPLCPQTAPTAWRAGFALSSTPT